MAGEMIAVVDLGSSKTSAALGTITESGEIVLHGVGFVPSEGMRAGHVIDLHNMTKAIEKSLLQAEDMAKCEAHHVFVNVTGAHLKGANHTFNLAIKHGDQKIRPLHMAHLWQKALQIELESDEHVVQLSLQDYAIDAQRTVQNPQGIVGSDLTAHMHIVKGHRNTLRNIINLMEGAGLNPVTLVPAAFAVGEAVLLPEEKELGMACVDIGASTTDVVVYHKGAIVYTASYDHGGEAWTLAIAHALGIPLPQAQAIKEQYGYVGELPLGYEAKITYEDKTTQQIVNIDLAQLGACLEAEVKALWQTIQMDLAKVQDIAPMPGGLVITGGSAQLRGLAAWVQQKFQCVVRVGAPQCVLQGAEPLKGASCALLQGLVRFGHHWQLQQKSVALKSMDLWKERISGFFSDLF